MNELEQDELDQDETASAPKCVQWTTIPIELFTTLHYDTGGQLSSLTVGGLHGGTFGATEYPNQGESAGELFEKAYARYLAAMATRRAVY